MHCFGMYSQTVIQRWLFRYLCVFAVSEDPLFPLQCQSPKRVWLQINAIWCHRCFNIRYLLGRQNNRLAAVCQTVYFKCRLKVTNAVSRIPQTSNCEGKAFLLLSLVVKCVVLIWMSFQHYPIAIPISSWMETLWWPCSKGKSTSREPSLITAAQTQKLSALTALTVLRRSSFCRY